MSTNPAARVDKVRQYMKPHEFTRIDHRPPMAELHVLASLLNFDLLHAAAVKGTILIGS